MIQLGKIKKIVLGNKTLFSNLSYLSILQVFSILIPLITYPYLIRVLGAEKYGLVVFAQAVVAYFLILVSFGFNLSATKLVSVHRDNKEKINEIFCSVVIIKACLFIFSMIALGLILYFIPQARNEYLLFYLSAYVCIYDVFFPIWYFQGKENIRFTALTNITVRLIFVALIFVFVKSKSDYLYVPIINGIGSMLAILISFYVLFVKDKIVLYIPNFKIIKYYFLDSIPFFISNVSIQLYVNTNKVIVGTFLGMTDVAYYDLAEKILNILKMPITIIGQVVYPKVSREKNLLFIKRVFNNSVALNLAIVVFIFLLAKIPVLLLGGVHMLDAVNVLRILVFTVPIIAMSNIYGIQLLIPFGYQKAFTRIIVESGIVYIFLFLLLLFLKFVNLYSVAAITVLTEVYVTTSMYLICKKKNILWKSTTI